MAVILKNKSIEPGKRRKLTYNERSYSNPVDNYPNELLKDHVQTPVAEAAGNSVLLEGIENHESEFVLTDNKIIYRDSEYYNESYLTELVNDLDRKRQDDFEQEKSSQMEVAREKGYEEGIEIAKEEYKERIDELVLLINGIQETVKAKIEENIELIQKIIFISLVKILGDEIRNDQQRINIINSVVKSIVSNKTFTLRISKKDHEILKSHPEMNNLQEIAEIVSDNRVSLGGCIIETDNGIFDGRLEVQLARIKEAIEST